MLDQARARHGTAGQGRAEQTLDLPDQSVLSIPVRCIDAACPAGISWGMQCPAGVCKAKHGEQVLRKVMHAYCHSLTEQSQEPVSS